ncbi:MAG: hypothetical protein LBS98_06480 [Coriobacteriales bacterium]|jgi:hypothetical protein|nr:hypothetical protein [Coriobacteriales bacterium]
MGGFSIMLLFFVLLAVLVVVMLLVVAVAALGAGASVLAVGGLTGATAIKDPVVKRLLLLGSLSVLLFGFACIGAVSSLFSYDSPLLPEAFVCLMGVGMVTTAIIGIVQQRRIPYLVVRVLLIIFFAIVITVGVLVAFFFGLWAFAALF